MLWFLDLRCFEKTSHGLAFRWSRLELAKILKSKFWLKSLKDDQGGQISDWFKLKTHYREFGLREDLPESLCGVSSLLSLSPGQEGGRIVCMGSVLRCWYSICSFLFFSLLFFLAFLLHLFFPWPQKNPFPESLCPNQCIFCWWCKKEEHKLTQSFRSRSYMNHSQRESCSLARI